MISQFFVISMRGDTIIHKECKTLTLHTTVRMEQGVGKYTTTQEMFLAKVGISNSYSEDTREPVVPFFVRLKNHSASQ